MTTHEVLEERATPAPEEGDRADWSERRSSTIVGSTLLLVVLLGLWQLLVEVRVLNAFFFGSPLGIASSLRKAFADGTAFDDLGTTSVEALLGFIIGLLVGVVGAFALFQWKFFARISLPYLSALNALPRVLLAPIFILWLGIGISSKVLLAVSVVSLVTFFATYAGLQSVDQQLLSAMRVFGARDSHIRKYVLLPSAVSFLFGSLRVSVGFAFTSAVVGEYLGATSGLGYMISQAQGVFDTNGAFAGLVIVMVTVMIILAVVGRLEKRLLRWRE